MKNKLENIDLRSEEVQDILTKVPHWMIRWGSILFLILIVLLLAITWFVKYPDIISTQVVVTTQIPPQKEYAKTTGELDTILVIDNQLVATNQPLAIIENSANFSDVLLLKSILDTVSVSNKGFYFPFDELPILFLGEMEANFALFENAYIQYSLNKELQPFTNESVANSVSVLELKNRLQSIQLQKEIYQSELVFKEKDLARYKTLFKKGVISAQEYENKQQALLVSQRNLNTLNQSVSQTIEAISNARKTSRGTQISKTKQEVVLMKDLIQSFNRLKKNIKDWELRYVLQSNMTGKVSFMNYWNKNQTVNLGDLVFTIIPIENSSFIAKLKAPTQNSGKIEVGQSVNIKLQNYPDAEFGMLRGQVESISSVPNNDGFYLIDVSLPEKLITSYNKEIAFKQEMSGTAEIITEDLRLIERFFYQFRNVLSR